MANLTLYHGSSNIIEIPRFGLGREDNDYGRGFYCTEHLDLAKEWAVTEARDGYANEYSLNLEDLVILNLHNYTPLHWLAVLVANRRFDVQTPLMERSMAWLRENFLPDISRFDVVVGYRADDSYFSFAKAFLSNQISYTQLCRAMKLGRLGDQYVLKSELAFSNISFKRAEYAGRDEFLQKKTIRDQNARSTYRAILSEDDIFGLFIRDMIREGIKEDDPRL